MHLSLPGFSPSLITGHWTFSQWVVVKGLDSLTFENMGDFVFFGNTPKQNSTKLVVSLCGTSRKRVEGQSISILWL